MSKKDEEVIELTEVVEEPGEKKSESGEESEFDDLEKELDALLEGDEQQTNSDKTDKKEGSDKEASLDDELDTLLDEEPEETETSEYQSEQEKKDDLDIDSIFDKLDKDLNIDDEESGVDSQQINQDEIDSLFEENQEDKDSDEELVKTEEEEKTIADQDIPEAPDEKLDTESIEETEAKANEATAKETFADNEQLLGTLKQHITEIIDPKIKSVEEKLNNKLELILAEVQNQKHASVDEPSFQKDIDNLKHEIEKFKDLIKSELMGLSEKINNWEKVLKGHLKEVVDGLRDDLRQEINVLIPKEAAKIIREEIEAMEEELKEEEE